MKKHVIIFTLIFQVLFLAKIFPQTQYDRFLIAFVDYSNQSTALSTMVQQYKNMKEDYYTCSIAKDRLAKIESIYGIIPNLLYASSNPSKAFMDSAHAYGIKIILTNPDNCVIWSDRTCEKRIFHNEYNSMISQQGLAYYGNHPALLGFQISNEPDRCEHERIINYANDIRLYNPDLLRYITLTPSYGHKSDAEFTQYILDYIDSIQPNILSFDHYPIMQYIPDSINNSYSPSCLFVNLDIMSRISVESGIPFNYAMTSLNGKYYPYTSDNFVSKYATAYFIYSGLIYGAKGITHFVGKPSLNLSSFTPEHRAHVRNINKKILDHEDILLSLQFKSVYHKTKKSTIGPGNEKIRPTSDWSNFALDPLANEIFIVNNPLIAAVGSTIDSLAVSFLTDHSGNRYFWVFNKSISASENIQLNLKAGSGVVDVLNGNCLLAQNPTIHLEPAEAKLFKFVPHPNMPVNYTITQNTTWSTPIQAAETVTIKNNATLTITSTVNCNSNVSFIVQPGGWLVVDGGTLTNACEGEMWQGIINNQGNIDVSNGGTISNAICGISVEGSGKVFATTANFTNNKLGVKFESSSGQNSAWGTFSNTDFVLDNGYLGNPAEFEAHLKMESSCSVNITSCRFISFFPLSSNKAVVVSKSAITWFGNNQLHSVSLDIKSGALLTNKGTLSSNQNSKITVHPGAQLNIDGGTFTSVTSSIKWQGITVLGDSTKPLEQPFQGVVLIYNNGKIENALCALTVMGGAFIITDSALFCNNKMGVKFEPLASGQSGASGNFIKTSFIQDNLYIGDPSTAEEHLLMEKCGQIHISDCLFSRPSSIHNPKGITVTKTAVHFLSNNYLSSVPMNVLAGSNVTVSNKMFCSDKITVYPAGKLVIYGSTLSNHSNMPLWEGIDVLGDPNPVALQPGVVQITNGGTIKNAKTGITAIAGGVVNAQNAHFIGNRVGVHFKPTVTQSGTSGTFTQTEFALNFSSFGNLIDFGAFLKMDSCKQVTVTDCSFSGVASGNPDNGVVATNASTLWTGDNQLLSAPVSLYNNATLTNTGIIKSNENADIAVYAGGKLIVDGGTLTNASSGIMWKGITVQGSLKTGISGSVVLQNGGIIKNALLGIHALWGGSVTATDAYFLNNKVGAQMEQGSTATFTNTQFNTTYSYPGNYLTFDVHLKLFNNNPVIVSGCTFVNETDHVQIGGKTNNTGIQVFNANMTCLNNSFSGFCTALSANNSGKIPFLFVSNNIFSNNINGIKLNGNNYHNVRDNQLALTIKDAVGIATSQATGYSITENTIKGTMNYKNIGMQIINSGVNENRIYKNYFKGDLFIGIQALDVNSWQDPSVDPKALTGLQFLCNVFDLSDEASLTATDIMVGIQYNPNASHSVRYYQGNPKEPAGNDFFSGGHISIANYSNYNIHYCYSTLSINEILKIVVGSVTKEYLFIPSDCPTRFDKNSMTLEEALAQYDRWNEAAAYWLLQLTNSEANQEENMYSYYSALKENFFNSIIIAAMEAENSPSNFEGVDGEAGRGSLFELGIKNYELGITNYETLRFLFNYRNHYTDNLCIVETYLAESNFTEALETLAKMYEKFKITKEQEKELTGLQIYVLWLQQIENEGKNIYELSEKELDYLVNFVKTNTGRGAVFAKIILCELYGICIEAESRTQNAEGEKGEGGSSHSAPLTTVEGQNDLYKDLVIYPNPGKNYFTVVSDVADCRFELIDVRGVVQQTVILQKGIHTIDTSLLPEGFYFYRAITSDKVMSGKWVKVK